MEGETGAIEISPIARKFCNPTKEVGRGREKIAFEVGEKGDKVWVQYHSSEFQNKPPEFFKAQFYLHRILHLLLPNNFPDVHLAVHGGILFDRVPDTPDFTKAKEIMRKYYEQKQKTGVGYWNEEDHDWMVKKQNEIYSTTEFQEVVRLLEEIGVAFGKDRSAWELAVPVNTVIIDSHPMILEIIDPITVERDEVSSKVQMLPTLQPDWLKDVIGERVKDGKLDKSTAEKIERFSDRYMENGQKAAKFIAKTTS